MCSPYAFNSDWGEHCIPTMLATITMCELSVHFTSFHVTCTCYTCSTCCIIFCPDPVSTKPTNAKRPLTQRESTGYVDMGAAMRESAAPGSGQLGAPTPAGHPPTGGGGYVDPVCAQSRR